MRLERIQFAIDYISRTQRHETSQSLVHHQRAIEGTLNQLLETHFGGHKIPASESNSALLCPSNEPDAAISPINESLQSSSSARGYSNDMASTVRFSTSYQEPCKPGCGCKCHRRHRWRSPPMLDHLLGTMFLGYVGLPSISAKCDIRGCLQQRSLIVSFSYYFPAWFLMRILHIQIRHRQNLGPEQLLRVSRRVSKYSEIFTFASKGDVEGMKSVLKDGRGSPFDVCILTGGSALNVRYITHSLSN